MASSEKCSQCQRTAAVDYAGNPLCVEHHLMMQQASYLQASQLAAQLNLVSEEIARGTGYIVPPTRIQIPRPPFQGDILTLNHIDVSNSTIGAINTGTVKNLDVAISLFQGQRETEIASAVKEFTQALVDSDDLDASTKNDVAEQLAFLVTQVKAKPDERSSGMVKSVISGIRSLVSSTSSLVTLWEKLQPLIEKALSGA